MIAVILFLESLGGGEVMVIMLFILIFFGADKIPGLAKGLGKGMREFKDAMNGIQSDLKQGMAEAEQQIAKAKESLPDINSHPLSQPMNSTVEAPKETPVIEAEATPIKHEEEKIISPPTTNPPPAGS